MQSELNPRLEKTALFVAKELSGVEQPLGSETGSYQIDWKKVNAFDVPAGSLRPQENSPHR
jgi:hypothetical protein